MDHNIKLLIIILIIVIIIFFYFYKQNDCECMDPIIAENTTESSKENKMLITLKDAKYALDNINIEFFLACGTALGAIRENKFISYDGDIDLGVFSWQLNKTDVNKIINSFQNNFILWKQYGDFDHGLELTFKHKITEINVDIFFMYEDILDNKKIWWSASYGSQCDNFKFAKCRFWNSPFCPKKIMFYGLEFDIPDENYLIESYGVDWKTPKKFSYSDGLINGGYTNIIDEK